MPVRTFLAAAALVLVAASCGGSGGAGQSNTHEPTQSVTTTAAPAGEHFGYIRSVSAAGPATTLAFDEAEFLKGKEAQQAAEEDGVVEPGEAVPNDYYIRDTDHLLLTYRVRSDARVTVLTRG